MVATLLLENVALRYKSPPSVFTPDNNAPLVSAAVSVVALKITY